jgi:hypothetical protein
MGEVIQMEEFRERKAASIPEHKRRRLAEIALEKLLLQSEENQIRRLLGEDPSVV